MVVGTGLGTGLGGWITAKADRRLQQNTFWGPITSTLCNVVDPHEIRSLHTEVRCHERRAELKGSELRLSFRAYENICINTYIMTYIYTYIYSCMHKLITCVYCIYTHMYNSNYKLVYTATLYNR